MGERLDSKSSEETVLKGNRKFIVTDEGRVLLGKEGQTHEEVARAFGIDDMHVRGGGVASCDYKVIHGYSGRYGTYDASAVKKVFPEWEVLESERREDPAQYE